MTDEAGARPDLAAMLQPLLRALVAAERPVLDRHRISMWGYIVLTALSGGPARTQAALAHAIGADKTRIIPTLDGLQDAGLISRDPDPADRRARLLSITADGERRRAAVQTEIRAQEDRVLEALPPTERRAFLRALARLSTLGTDEILGLNRS